MKVYEAFLFLGTFQETFKFISLNFLRPFHCSEFGLIYYNFPNCGYRLTISFYSMGEFKNNNSAMHIKHQRSLMTKMLFNINKKTKFVENKQQNEF